MECVDDLTRARTSVARALPDVVVCDLQLGDESGWQFYRWLESTHPQLTKRFVLITGDLDDETARFTKSAGVPVLHKPLQTKVLMQTVSAMAKSQQP